MGVTILDPRTGFPLERRRLSAERPVVGIVFLVGQFVGAFELVGGWFRGGNVDLEGVENDVPEVTGVERQVSNEASVGAVAPVAGSIQWFALVSFHQGGIETIEQGSVVQNEMLASFLGVAGDLATAECKVGDAVVAQGDVAFEKGFADASEDVTIGFPNGAEFGPALMAQDESEVEASRSLEDASAPRASPHDGDVVLLTGLEMDFGADGLGDAEDDEVRRAFPESEAFAVAAMLGAFEEDFVEGQVLARRDEGYVK